MASVIRFENCEIDLTRFEVRRSGAKVPLEKQPFNLLVLLINRNGDVVPREEIVRELWGPNVFVETDRSINNAIRKIRLALKDDPEHPRFVETVAGRGYRFIAPLTSPVADPETSLLDIGKKIDLSGLQGARPTSGQSPRRRALIAAGALFVVAVTGLCFRSFLRSRPVPHSIRSIAVLPLNNLSADPGQEYFVDGMTDELTTELARVGALKVISVTSAMHYKGSKKTLPEIAKELNVDGIVEGSVMRSGNRVRISAQLIQAATDQHIWADSYEQDLTDVLQLQDKVAQAIVLQVRVHLTSQQRAQFGSAPLVDPGAYEAYLKGRSLFHMFTPQQLEQAESYFREAIKKDPGFAPSYVGLADCYVHLGAQRWIAPEEASRPAKEALSKALELDAALGEAHATLGWVSWRFDWDWQTAEREFKNAVALNPSYAFAHANFSLFLSWIGRDNEAVAEGEKFSQLDPASPLAGFTKSYIAYHRRDYKTLIEVSRQNVASKPGIWVGYYHLGVGYEGSGQVLNAIPQYQKAVDLSQGDSDPTAALAHAYAKAGRQAEADRILRDLLHKSETTYVSSYMIATIYAGLGAKDKAFDFLEKAYQERSVDIPYHIKADPRIDNLRSDPRFQDLMRRVGLPLSSGTVKSKHPSPA